DGGREEVDELVGVRHDKVFLEDGLDGIGDRLQDCPEPYSVRSVTVLEASEQPAFDQCHVGEGAQQHHAQDQRFHEGYPQRVVGQDPTSSRAKSPRALSTTRLARSACTRPCAWSGRLGRVINPLGTASVNCTVARRHRPATRSLTSLPSFRPCATPSSGCTLSRGPPRAARKCGLRWMYSLRAMLAVMSRLPPVRGAEGAGAPRWGRPSLAVTVCAGMTPNSGSS